MDAKLLQRIMDLAEKTGDRVIVMNPKSGTAHAILPFDAYERMAQGNASLQDFQDADPGPLEPVGMADDIEDLHPHEEPEEAGGIGEMLAVRMEEIEKRAIREDVALIKAQPSQKEATGLTSLDVLDDEANEEQYYLEPLE
jgi:hypothetical protein